MTGKKWTIASTLALVLSLATIASASDRYFNPDGGGATTPRLGFLGHMEYGFGMVVDRVFTGSLAERVGLEPGDTIVRINDRPIRSDADYSRALRYSGGRIRLLVDDVRGRGLVWTRPVYLDNGSGPVKPRLYGE